MPKSPNPSKWPNPQFPSIALQQRKSPSGSLLVDSFIFGWLVGWLVGPLGLIGSLVESLMESLVESLVESFVLSLVGSLVGSLVRSLVELLVQLLVGSPYPKVLQLAGQRVARMTTE